MAPGSPDVRFTPVTVTDLPRLNEIVNDPAIIRFLDLVPPVSMERTAGFYSLAKANGYLLWNILVPDDTTIGCAGLFPEDPATKFCRTASFFLYLLPAYWGKGIGMQSVQFLEAGARNRNLHRLECQVVAGNSRAIRLYERLGFVREGARRDAFFHDGKYEDLLVMGKLLD